MSRISNLPRLLLIGNYAADHQQSMERFASMLHKIYSTKCYVKYVTPPVILSNFVLLPKILRKYIAYIDKLILFPIWLIVNSHKFDITHIVDHGNSYYSFFCPSSSSIVTCHDLLAVRGALGDPEAACTPSPLGPWLQRLIMLGLNRCDRITFVSQATFSDFLRLTDGSGFQRHKIIPNCLNASFTNSVTQINLTTKEISLLPTSPFLLMVGSALPRKNRNLALQLLEKLGESSQYQLVFAGEPLTPLEERFRHDSPLGSRIYSIVNPSHALLNMLYCKAHVLLFPSVSEGFGWPLIEAQACGCPVIASNTTSIPEVVGIGGKLVDPHDANAFLKYILRLENQQERLLQIEEGYINLERFSFNNVASQFLTFALDS
jgi:glycosyltransferase involved in cell wall biosynthesis